MKKNMKRFLLSWVLLLVLIISLPVPARAEKYMEGEHADFRIVLDENGGAEITETWKCFFGGDTITRYRRYYTVPDRWETDIEIREVSMDGKPMQLLKSPETSRPVGCAAVYENDEGATTVEMYLSAKDESHTFEIHYYVTNAVILYNDAAEFHWNLTSENEAFDIAEMTGLIEIPYGTRDMGLYFWGHGPNENAYFDAIVDENDMVNQFELYNENIPKDRAVTVRFAMPPQLFPGSTRTRDWDELQNILYEEHGWAELSGSVGETVPMDTYEETYEETYEDTYEYTYEEPSLWEDFLYEAENILFAAARILKITAIVLSFAPLCVVFFFGNAMDCWILENYLPKAYEEARLKPAQAPRYYRSLPDSLKPAMVNILMSTYRGTEEGTQAQKKGNAYAATVLDLVERGLLILQQNRARELTYLVAPEAEQLVETEYEKNIIELYTAAGAAEKPKSTKEITDYMRKEYAWCKAQYKEFNWYVDEDYQKLGYTQFYTAPEMPGKLSVKIGLIWGVCAAIAFSMESILLGGIPLAAIYLGAASGLVNGLLVKRIWEIVHPGFPRLNQEGEDRYAMWKAYATFLQDFTLFDEREVQDVKVWRRHLVYATALGCSAKVMGALEMKFPEVYESLSHDLAADNVRYDEVIRSAESIDRENGYTIRPTSSSSGGSSSDSSDWGGFSDCGGDSDSGSSGSDFD